MLAYLVLKRGCVMAHMPSQRPGKSEQVVLTPREFLVAVEHRLGISKFDFDLAASEDNKVTLEPLAYYDEEMDALIQPWTVGTGWNWCNPPYAKIGPWVEKAWDEMLLGAKTAMLVPASVGSNWWRGDVDGIAHVLFLNGRLTFVGHTSPYPKDLALLLYSRAVRGGYECWNWRLEGRL